MVSIALNGRIALHAVLILPIKYDGTADRTSDSGVNGTIGAVNTEKSATSADFCFCCVSGHGLDSFNGANLCPIRRRRNRTKIRMEFCASWKHDMSLNSARFGTHADFGAEPTCFLHSHPPWEQDLSTGFSILECEDGGVHVFSLRLPY